MVIMGAAKDFSDLWTWDSELLDALTNLPLPVLLIPHNLPFNSIKNIGFACDYKNAIQPVHVDFIKRMIDYTHAQLHVVHITRSKPINEEVKKENEQQLQEIAPQYHTIEDPNVIDAVAHFVAAEKLDLLIVVPHKHGMWYSIFNQSHTKQMAKLNHLPILALHD